MSQDNICLTDDLEKLQEVTLEELEVGNIFENSFIWVQTVMKAVLMNDLILVVQDKNKDVVSLTLYNNTLNQEEIEKYFPKGVKFAIK